MKNYIKSTLALLLCLVVVSEGNTQFCTTAGSLHYCRANKSTYGSAMTAMQTWYSSASSIYWSAYFSAGSGSYGKIFANESMDLIQQGYPGEVNIDPSTPPMGYINMPFFYGNFSTTPGTITILAHIPSYSTGYIQMEATFW